MKVLIPFLKSMRHDAKHLPYSQLRAKACCAAVFVHVSTKHRHHFEAVVRTHHVPQSLVLREWIILMAGAGGGVRDMARALDCGGCANVQRWRASAGQPLVERLGDALCPSTPPTLQPEQIGEIIALACEPPSDSTPLFTHWTHAIRSATANESGKVEDNSAGSVRRFLCKLELKPRRTRAQINTPRDADFTATCRAVCQTYQLAPARAAAVIETHRIGEMTGVQALERAAPTQPMGTGSPERSEFGYIRLGTTILIADFDVATGPVNLQEPTRSRQAGSTNCQ